MAARTTRDPEQVLRIFAGDQNFIGLYCVTAAAPAYEDGMRPLRDPDALHRLCEHLPTSVRVDAAGPFPSFRPALPGLLERRHGPGVRVQPCGG
jgi:hypothetical protein